MQTLKFTLVPKGLDLKEDKKTNCGHEKQGKAQQFANLQVNDPTKSFIRFVFY